MDVDVLVATFGETEWERRGDLAADDAAARGYCVTRLHSYALSLAEVRNAAARQATRTWLCFLDGDDRLGSGYLEAIEEAYDATPMPQSEWSMYAPALSFDKGRTSRIPNEGRWPQLNECVIGTVVRRDVFVELGGFREWPSLEDYDLWLRCYAYGIAIRHVPGAVYLAGVNRDGRNRDQSCVHDIRAANKEVFL